jgi:hypothetical protein
VVISPIQWADKKAQEMAKRVQRGILDGAEDNNGNGDGDGGAVAAGQYPNLTNMRRRENQCLPWSGWRRCGFEGQEERRLLNNGGDCIDNTANVPQRD